eukprot:312802-Chlamydomonas_euryale.AAC.1
MQHTTEDATAAARVEQASNGHEHGVDRACAGLSTGVTRVSNVREKGIEQAWKERRTGAKRTFEG